MTDEETLAEMTRPETLPRTRIALVTTTINVPKALALYRKIDADVFFFVVADKKTPPEAESFCKALSNTIYLSVDDQQKLDYKILQHLPYNSITRRNIGTLEALKWGADIIIAWDDDNLPLHCDYFLQFSTALTQPFDGMLASSPSDWFDPGELLLPRAPHRGFPHGKKSTPYFEPFIDAQVGVCAGLVLGDPDIGAFQRLANAPLVHSASAVLQSGFVVDPRQTWTVFNTQNTAFRRALAPAMLLCPQFDRYDDIIASLVTQRVMTGQGWCVRQGQPFVYQQRNEHDIVRDLALELWGMQNIAHVVTWLDRQSVPDDPFDAAQKLWTSPSMHVLHIDGSLGLARAWFDDLEQVL